MRQHNLNTHNHSNTIVNNTSGNGVITDTSNGGNGNETVAPIVIANNSNSPKSQLSSQPTAMQNNAMQLRYPHTNIKYEQQQTVQSQKKRILAMSQNECYNGNTECNGNSAISSNIGNQRQTETTLAHLPTKQEPAEFFEYPIQQQSQQYHQHQQQPQSQTQPLHHQTHHHHHQQHIQQQQQQQQHRIDSKRSSWAPPNIGGQHQVVPLLANHKREVASVAPNGGNNSNYVSQNGNTNATLGPVTGAMPPVAHSKSSSTSIAVGVAVAANAAASVGPPSWGAPQVYRQANQSSHQQLQLQSQSTSNHHLQIQQQQNQSNSTPIGNSPTNAITATTTMLQQDIYASAAAVQQGDMYRRPTVFVSQATPTYAYNRTVVAPPPAHNSSSRQVNI